jgi:hypothetical protein
VLPPLASVLDALPLQAGNVSASPLRETRKAIRRSIEAS